jgi:hypothetical protein
MQPEFRGAASPLRSATASRNPKRVLDCGGKRSATPLWLGAERLPTRVSLRSEAVRASSPRLLRVKGAVRKVRLVCFVLRRILETYGA